MGKVLVNVVFIYMPKCIRVLDSAIFDSDIYSVLSRVGMGKCTFEQE